jgi:hypothetical protein
MKTAISIPDRLFRSTEKAAHKLQISRSRFYAAAASHFLHEIKCGNVTDRLNAVYDNISKDASTLPAGISKLQSAVIKKDSW